MGKCNLLAPVRDSNGNFILFSQYAEDLTRSSQSEDYYRVTPSRYVLMNLSSSEKDEVAFAELFQNYYENSCAVMRSNKSSDWDPECASAMFWKALFKYNLLSAPILDADRGMYYSQSIVGLGDINITSTKQFDGVNYSEIYVSVPQGESRKRVFFSSYSSEETKSIIYPYGYIAGWPDSIYPYSASAEGDGRTNPPTRDGEASIAEAQRWLSNHLTESEGAANNYYDSTVEVSGDTNYIYTLKEHGDMCFDPDSLMNIETAGGMYTFNAVLVLYDIHKRILEKPEDIVVYHDIPMGLYLTGSPKNSSGRGYSITNPVTIWTRNSDIYEQGTSYGIRICTRYLSTQNQLEIIDTTIEDVSEMYDQYAAVMGKIGDSQVKMDAIVNQMAQYQNNITSHLSNIKNYKVNVPYIKNIGGVDYWFVNGRNLGVPTVKTSMVWENY